MACLTLQQNHRAPNDLVYTMWVSTKYSLAECREVANRVEISSGDVLLIRTGRWAKVANDGQWSLLKGIAGSHASLAAWLKTRNVAIIGSDGVSDVIPSGVEGLFNPLHELVLVALGMPILDNLDLELLARVAKQKKRPINLNGRKNWNGRCASSNALMKYCAMQLLFSPKRIASGSRRCAN